MTTLWPRSVANTLLSAWFQSQGNIFMCYDCDWTVCITLLLWLMYSLYVGDSLSLFPLFLSIFEITEHYACMCSDDRPVSSCLLAQKSTERPFPVWCHVPHSGKQCQKCQQYVETEGTSHYLTDSLIYKQMRDTMNTTNELSDDVLELKVQLLLTENYFTNASLVEFLHLFVREILIPGYHRPML